MKPHQIRLMQPHQFRETIDCLIAHTHNDASSMPGAREGRDRERDALMEYFRVLTAESVALATIRRLAHPDARPETEERDSNGRLLDEIWRLTLTTSED